MTNKHTVIKKVKGFSSAYPNVCNLKILPNIDKTWITIQDDVGTSITIKLSDLELAISIIKAESEGYSEIKNEVKDLSKRVETLENQMKKDKEDQLNKLKAELDYAKFCCVLQK